VLTFYRNRVSAFDFIQNSQSSFEPVENWKIEIPYRHHGQSGHKFMIENFANAILNGEQLIASAVEGLNSLMLGNAIMLSSFQGQPVELPIDAAAYAAKLQELIQTPR
jgi:predicted dehydrogenase